MIIDQRNDLSFQISFLFWQLKKEILYIFCHSSDTRQGKLCAFLATALERIRFIIIYTV